MSPFSTGTLSGMDMKRLRRTARRQLGLFTREQAAGCGASAFQIRRRVESGEWRVVLGKVLTTADLPVTLPVRDRAAALAVPGGVLAGPSAARAWGMTVPDDRIFLAVGRVRNPAISGVRYLRSSVEPRDLANWEGALVTTRSRAVVDCLTILPENTASNLLDEALNRRWLTLDELAARLQSRVGRHGNRRLASLLHARRDGTRSAAERLCATLLGAAGIGGWRANAAIHDRVGLIGVGDFVFDEARLVIEIDGQAFHVTGAQFQRDRARQNRLVAAGWTVLRFTWQDLTERPAYVIAMIQKVLCAE